MVVEPGKDGVGAGQQRVSRGTGDYKCFCGTDIGATAEKAPWGRFGSFSVRWPSRKRREGQAGHPGAKERL